MRFVQLLLFLVFRFAVDTISLFWLDGRELRSIFIHGLSLGQFSSLLLRLALLRLALQLLLLLLLNLELFLGLVLAGVVVRVAVVRVLPDLLLVWLLKFVNVRFGEDLFQATRFLRRVFLLVFLFHQSLFLIGIVHYPILLILLRLE